MSQVVAEDRGLPPLFDIGAVLKTLWDRRLLILGITGAALLAAVLYISVTKPIYTATSSILVDPRDSRATNFNNVLPGIGADSAAIASQVSVIDSTDLLRGVFDAEHLRDDPEFLAGGLLSSLLSTFKTSKKKTDDAIFDSFRRHVSVDREGLTYVIDIAFTSHDPNKAARISKAIVSRYKASLEGEKESANSEVNGFLTGKIGGLQKAVSDAERDVQDFKFQHHIFDAGSGGTLQSQIDQLSTQLGTAQDQADQAQSKYDQAASAGTGPEGLTKLSEIVNSNTTDKLRDEYNQQAAALANAESAFGPKHPTIIRLQAQLGKIRGLMAREAGRIVRELKANRDIAVRNVKKLQAKLGALRDKSNQSDLAQVQLRQLQRSADAARAVLDDFLKRSQETEHLQGMQISQVRVISDAAPPIQPSWPKPRLLLPTSVILGLILGCALALALGGKRAAGERLPALLGTEPRRKSPARLSYTHADPVEPQDQGLTNLGTYNLPAATDDSVRNCVRAIRQEMSRLEDTAFLLSVQQLLVRITDRLDETGRPFNILLTSIGEGIESSAAATLIGIGLQHVDQKVLVVEMAGQSTNGHDVNRPSARRQTGPFTDPASGLQTVFVSAESVDAGGKSGALDEIMAESGKEFDFVLVIGQPLSHPAFSAALLADTDLVIFALNSEDWMAGAASWLRDRLSESVLERSATVVIDRGPDGPDEFSAEPAVFRARDRRKTAIAHG